MRVFLPATLPDLRRWLADGAAPAGPAYAVTPALREWYYDADADELEYAAQVAAGRGVLALLAADAAAPRRRVVVAADVPDDDVAVRDEPRSAVAVGVPVPTSTWVAAYVDDEGAADVVATAARQLDRARAGDDDAAFAVDAADAAELGWWAVQELPGLVGTDG